MSKPNLLSQDEVMQLMDRFINEFGMWNQFKQWLLNQGYTPADLGMIDDEEPTPSEE